MIVSDGKQNVFVLEEEMKRLEEIKVETTCIESVSSMYTYVRIYTLFYLFIYLFRYFSYIYSFILIYIYIWNDTPRQ